MKATRVVRALGLIDLKNLARDPLLRWMAGLPLAMALLVRWLVPEAVVRVSELIGFDLVPYYRPVLALYLLLMVPMLAGWVVGFLLLDQRDDGTLAALQVTPLTLPGFLAYRMAAPTVAGLLLTPPVLALSGLQETGLPGLLAAAVVAAPLAPISALCLGCFAANKVQGFAVMKASGILVLPPFIAYFARGWWELPLAVAPSYWAASVYWTAAEGVAPLWPRVVGGLLCQSLVLAWLVRRYDRVVRR